MSEAIPGVQPVELNVIILNFRTPELTVQCLNSLSITRNSSVSFDVTVIDNDSADDSISQIRRAIEKGGWEDWCQLLPSESNRGFAGGNNFGIKHVWKQSDEKGGDRPDYILLLNSDTIVHQGCLERCLEVIRSDLGIGALTCRLLNADRSLQVVCRKFPNPLRLILGAIGLPWKLPKLFSWADTEYQSWNMDVDSGLPDWIGGAFMMLRRSTLEQVGLLDEDFFFYGEDVEMCYRIRRAGWEIRYEPSVTTTHLGGASSDDTRMMSENKSVARWRARYLFLRKSYGRLPMWCVRLADLTGLGLRMLILWIFFRGNSERASDLRLAIKTVAGYFGSLN